jgi:DNA-binding XRE family transcriptional regulator
VEKGTLMDAETQKRLEADGWVFGDAQSFLGLSDAEIDYIDLALGLAYALKQRRMEMGLTQQAAAEVVGTSQSRFAKMETGHPSASVDRLIRALFALGVRLTELASLIQPEIRENVA